MVRAATLKSQFSVEELTTLRDPQEHTETDSSPEGDPYLKFSVRNFIDLLGSSQDTYSRVRQNLQELFPDALILSYDQVKRRIRKLSVSLHGSTICALVAVLASPAPFQI